MSNATDETVTCNRCGRSWQGDTTPAGRCKFEEDCQSSEERMADAYVADIKALERGEWPDDLDPADWDHDDAIHAWIDSQLEIYVDGRRSFGGDWTIRSIGVLMAYGGPGARLTIHDEDGDATVSVYSWGDEATRHVDCPTLAAYLYGLADDD